MQLNIEWSQVIFNLWHLTIAFVLAIPIALDRERASRGAGLRTFPLVAVAACGGDIGRAVIVGDSENDIGAAIAAGVPSVAVSFGYAAGPVDGLGAGVVIDRFDELIEAIDRLMPAA